MIDAEAIPAIAACAVAAGFGLCLLVGAGLGYLCLRGVDRFCNWLARLLPLVLALAALFGAGPAGADCLIIGDSIAADLGGIGGRCAVAAQSGLPSSRIIPLARPAGLVVISAGSNDPANPRLVGNLEAIRVAAGAARVLWVLPAVPGAAAAVRAVSARWGDRVLNFEPGRDGVHPRSYTGLRAAVAAALEE